MKLSWSLARYLSKTFLIWLLILWASVMALVVVFDLYEFLRQSANKPHITAIIIIKMLILHLPFISAKLLPFITLFASFMTLWQFNRNSELTVMRAAGLSVWQIMIPVMATASLVGIFELFAINPIAAFMTERYQRIKAYQFQGKKKGILVSSQGMWVRHASQHPPVVIKIKSVNLKKKLLKNVMLLDYNPDNILEARYHAKRVYFTDKPHLRLEDVWHVPMGGKPKFHKKLNYDNDLTLDIIKKGQPDPETLSFWKLPKFIKWLNNSGISGRKYKLYWHSLIAQILLFIGMVILAGSCSFRPVRQGGAVYMIAIGLSTGFALYILRDITYALGAAGTLPIGFAAWMPATVTFLTGSALLIYVEDG